MLREYFMCFLEMFNVESVNSSTSITKNKMKNKCIVFILLIAILLIAFAQTAFSAEAITENEATPDILSEPEAILLITEVNFKNSEADWAEIYYESPSGKSLNLKGISFIDDNLFKVMTNFEAKSGQYMLVTFKSATTDKYPYIYSSRTGLTGTTEQLIMRDPNGKVIDAICWTSSNPTTDEIGDMVDLYGQKGWHAADTAKCLKSESVKNNQSIIRNGFTDTNSATDWTITEEITPGAANPNPETPSGTTSNQTGATTNTQTTSANPTEIVTTTSENNTTAQTPTEENSDLPGTTDTNPETIDQQSETDENTIPGPITQAIKLADKAATAKSATSKTTSSKTTSKAASKKSTSTSKTAVYSNGDLSDKLIITEIMPNPEGSDTKNEWIEITNTGETPLNLGNWTLDDGENGSKPYTFPDTTEIAAGTSLSLNITETKISLGNTEDMVRLADPDGTIISEISYEEAPSGQSYSLIKTTNEDGEISSDWAWTGTPTPGTPNPIRTKISAEVTAEPVFGEKYYFTVKTATAPETIIGFSEKEIQAPLAKATLLKGTKLSLVLEGTPDKEGYKLISYEIVTPPSEPAQPGLIVPGIIGSFVTAAGSTVYFLRKKIPWQFLLKMKS